MTAQLTTPTATGRADTAVGVEAVAGEWDSMMVLCAGSAWGAIRMPDHQIAEQLTRYTPVLFVEPPISEVVRRRRGETGPRLRIVAPRLAVLTPPALPGRTRPIVRSTTAPSLRLAVRRAVRELRGSVSTVVGASLDPVLTTVPGARRVLFGTDDFVAGAELMRVPVARLRRQESRRLSEADVVIAISEALATSWRARGLTVGVVPNGVDASRFAAAAAGPPPPDVTLTGPSAVFAGQLTDRIDLAMLEAVAGRGIDLLLVGPHSPIFDATRLAPLLAHPNVQWVGARPHTEVPVYLSTACVGLVPYVDTRFNRHSFPLKALEYLAAGLPVVGTDLPALRDLCPSEITVATEPEAFADAVSNAVNAASDPARAEARRAFAAEHDWSQHARDFAALVGLTTDQPTAEPGESVVVREGTAS